MAVQLLRRLLVPVESVRQEAGAGGTSRACGGPVVVVVRWDDTVSPATLWRLLEGAVAVLCCSAVLGGVQRSSRGMYAEGCEAAAEGREVARVCVHPEEQPFSCRYLPPRSSSLSSFRPAPQRLYVMLMYCRRGPCTVYSDSVGIQVHLCLAAPALL